MRRCLVAMFLMLAAVVSAAAPADAGVRFALVIGNGKYVNAPALENPANDSADLAKALRGVGFEVIEQQDASREAMTKALREFSARLRGTEVALFFYAGHGIQLNGENYLLPVDADIQSPADVRFNTVDLTDIQQEMEGSGRVNIIILDACRNNPFADRLAQSGRAAPSRGLGRIDAAGEGSLIVYSTQPNNVALDRAGRNSPFTAALLKHVITPKALDYYEKAIEGGSSFSLNQLGVMYFSGKGVERDYHAAAEYFKQAADLDDGYALKFLANMNERGLLGGKNLEQAGALRARAQQVDPDSQNPDVPPPATTPVRHVASGRSHTIVIRRYRFIGCTWMWC